MRHLPLLTSQSTDSKPAASEGLLYIKLKRVSNFLTAHNHIRGHTVPFRCYKQLKVKLSLNQ